MVGYDTRFVSREFAVIMADVLAGSGIAVWLSDDYTPTPALSYAVMNLGTAGGVMITSSHNPFNWNGVKFKANYGGSGNAGDYEVDRAASRFAAPGAQRRKRNGHRFQNTLISAIKKFVDLDAIQKANFKFAIDVMYGAGPRRAQGHFHRTRYRSHRDSRRTESAVSGHQSRADSAARRAAAGDRSTGELRRRLATDGDADRLGAVAEDGSFVDSHKSSASFSSGC